MFLKTRPCPNCSAPHGHSAWAESNSSLVRPLRCKQCAQFFHQTGLRKWFWFSALAYLPVMLVWAFHWALGLLALVLGVLLMVATLNRGSPLAAGPKHG